MRIKESYKTAAQIIGTLAFVLSLVIGCKMIHTLTSTENTCVHAQIEAGVPKTNPVQMGCV